MRVDLCTREDDDTIEHLLSVILALGGEPCDGDAYDWATSPALASGVNSFRIGSAIVSVYADAWGVDLAGPDAIVHQILARMAPNHQSDDV